MKNLLPILMSVFFLNNAAAQIAIYYDATPPKDFDTIQLVYAYPGDSSLRKTAQDVAYLFGKAIVSSTYTVSNLGSSNPTTGIILKIDTLSTQRLQYCDVVGNGTDKI